MADSSLVPVLVGGGLTFLGGLISGLIGPLVLGWRRDKSEKTNKRREKLEELVTTLYDHHHWLKTLYSVKVDGQAGEISVPPFAKIEAIKHVYFPQFDKLVNDLAIASVAYERFLQGNYLILRQLDVSIPGHVTVKNDLAQTRCEFTDCFHSILAEIGKYAKREFQ